MRTDAAPPLEVPPMFFRVDDVIDGLMMLERQLLAREDRRGLFVSVYLQSNLTIREWIVRDRFLEGARVSSCLVAFANTFREALSRYESGAYDAVPAPWRDAFAAAGANACSLFQHVMLGINAHINRDLPHALLDARVDVHCDRSVADHWRVGDALQAATPRVRERLAVLYERRLLLANSLFGRQIDRRVDLAFRGARAMAWTLAKALQAASTSAERATVSARIEMHASARARRILASASPAQCLAAFHGPVPVGLS
jgi:hypothetical protein